MPFPCIIMRWVHAVVSLNGQFKHARCWESSQKKRCFTNCDKFNDSNLGMKKSCTVARTFPTCLKGVAQVHPRVSASVSQTFSQTERIQQRLLSSWICLASKSSCRKWPSDARSLNLLSLGCCIRLLAESQEPGGVNTEPLLVHKTTPWHDWLHGRFGPVT